MKHQLYKKVTKIFHLVLNIKFLHVEIVMSRIVGMKNKFLYAVCSCIKKQVLEIEDCNYRHYMKNLKDIYDLYID